VIELNWFNKKWGMNQEVPIDNILRRLSQLEQKYQDSLEDIKRLEEENIETTNVLYEIINSVNAVDSRIDILDEYYRNTEDVQ